MKIAVIGGGIFGVTAAVKLAKDHQVDLFEKEPDILQAASGINQYRLHRGYHYPRSLATALSSLKAEASFVKEYGSTIMEVDHYYCIAKKGSFTSASDYLKFCNQCGLEYTKTNLDLVRKDKVSLCLKVKENVIDPIKLRLVCQDNLKKAGVKLYLNTEATEKILEKYDLGVICTYARLNALLKKYPGLQRNYQYELVEKPVVRLPQSFANKSIIILDGPFMNLNPFSQTGFFVIGHVVHGVHQTYVGKEPVFDPKLLALIHRGIIKNPPLTNLNKFIKSGAEFLPELKRAEPLGSMFVIRTVLPYQDDTDARPTMIEVIDNKTVTVFSGKIGNCVEAAEQLAEIARQKTA